MNIQEISAKTIKIGKRIVNLELRESSIASSHQ